MLDTYKRWPKSIVLGQIISTPQLYKFYSLPANQVRLQESLTQENIIPLQYVEFLFTKIKQANVTTKSNSSRSNKLF